MAVARAVGGAAGGGNPGTHQGHHQIAGQRGGVGLGGGDDLGHRYRADNNGLFTSFIAWGLITDHDAHARGQPKPAMRRIVQRPRMFRRIHRPVLTGLVVVQQTEPAADHRVADLADWQRPGHRARPAQPNQPVGAGEVVDGGAAVHPVDAVPQRQGLGVAQLVTDATLHHQPFSQRATEGLNRGGKGRRALQRPGRQQVPRPLPRLGMGRILLVHRQFVADRAGGDEFATTGLLHQRHHPTAAGRIDPKPVVLIADLQPVDGLPAGRLGVLDHPVGAPAE